MKKTTFKVARMDCPSEEQMIRMKLEGMDNIRSLGFDIPERLLFVFHTGDHQEIYRQLETLKYDTTVLSSVKTNDADHADNSPSERKVLWIVLAINFSFFAIEFVAGIISDSMGLVADSLDMLADSLVYGLALLAVGGSMAKKKRTAKFAGYFQITLAIIGFVEVIRRFIGVERMPDFRTMIIVSLLALVANIVCLYLLHKNRSREAHMQASMIFTSNDIIINTGVIIAAILVHWLQSGIPDLIVGGIVFLIVARGAYRILQIAK